MILREAGLVVVRRDGLNMFYHVVKPRIFEVLEAVYAATGKSRPRLVHKHGRADCPCPKCHAVQHVPLEQVSIRS